MDRIAISSGSSFESQAGYARAVTIKHESFVEVFVSGCTGFDYATMTIAPDVEAQTRQAFANIAAALSQAGAGLEHVVRARYYLTRAEDFPLIAPILGEHFRPAPPAATALICGLIDPRMKIEIEVDARMARLP
jgi:enamine deaminase RidA (YjgF/YER057c/UK114 family)